MHELWRLLLHEHNDPPRLALAVFWGVFMGTVPLYGLQTGICIVTSRLFKLNTVAVVGAAQISNPLFAPFLIAGGIALGDFVRFGELRWPDLSEAEDFIAGLWILGGHLPDTFVSCFVGDTILGVVLGVIFGAVAYGVARWRQGRGGTASGEEVG